MLTIKPQLRYFVLPGHVYLNSNQILSSDSSCSKYDVFPAQPYGGIIRVKECVDRLEFIDMQYDQYPQFDFDGVRGGITGNSSGLEPVIDLFLA